MPGRFRPPGSDDFCRFVEAYFAEQDWTRDDSSKAGHTIFRIKGHWHNVSVPRRRDPLAWHTFRSLLDDVGIELQQYRDLAGTPAKLKAYCRSRRRSE